METGSYPFKLWSHPEYLLVEHCRNAWQIAAQLISKLDVNFRLIQLSDLKKIVQIATLFHDFGKATPWFQRYIHELDGQFSTGEKKLRQHSLISAIMTFGVLRQFYPLDLLLPALGFMIVRKHHGDLEDYANIFTVLDEEKEICWQQAAKIDYEEYHEIVAPYGCAPYVFQNFLEEVLQEVFEGGLRRFKKVKALFETGNDEYYYLVNLIFSILLQADKTDAIFHQVISIDYPEIASRDILDYRNKTFTVAKTINQTREAIFREVEHNLISVDKNHRIFSINAPTGSGKTITTFYAAVKLMEKEQLERIIYCLPFTSIIDQNYSVFQNIIQSAHLPDTTDLLLKHHHLAGLFYRSKINQDTEFTTDEALHFIEGWESRIIVTTFVQLLSSVISEKNSALRKFNKFNRAVIILDEIQTIPHHYWLLVKDVLMKLTELFNARILLVTATMPLIFAEDKGEIYELVTNKSTYFNRLCRIQLSLNYFEPDGTKWDVFLEKIANFCRNNPKRNILIVLNTIRSAQEVFHYLAEFKTGHNLEFLSSHVIPRERSKRIERLRQQLTKRPTILVSTQLIEVGVDIDFDLVIRDFAPLDALFQTCGRCNREMREGVMGTVYLFSVLDANGRKLANRIYDTFLLQKTLKVLANHQIIPESEFFNLSQAYYKEVNAAHSIQESEEILTAMSYLKYTDQDDQSLSQKLKIIDEDFKKSLYIEIDSEAQKIWKEYIELYQQPKDFERKIELREIRRKMMEYIINIPSNAAQFDPPFGIYHLSLENLNQYYDPVTGFKLGNQLQEESITLCF